MNIDNIELYFDDDVIIRGRKYYKEDKVKNLKRMSNDNFVAKVCNDRGKLYDVKIQMDKSGKINKIYCNCPYTEGGYYYCKHEFAVLLHLENYYIKEMSDSSSPDISQIISAYTKNAIDNIEEKQAHIEPELNWEDNKIFFKLKIGSERTYVVNDINSLVSAFNNQEVKRYGKNFVFKHSYESIDDKSRELMELAYSIYSAPFIYSYDKKNFPLNGIWLERFLNIYNEKSLKIGNEVYTVVEDKPIINVVVKKDNHGRLSLQMENPPIYLGFATKGYFLSESEKILYIAEKDFVKAVEPLMGRIFPKKPVIVSKKDIPSFYNVVIKQIDKQVNIQNIGILDDIMPPQLCASLYVDVTDNDEIVARLEYVYDNQKYPTFYNQDSNPFCDKPEEINTFNAVSKYFNVQDNNNKIPFIICDEDKIFDFITFGMSELSKLMEINVSDRFARIKVRRPVSPTVGVRTSSGLLEIDISASDYSKEELLEMLQSYRRGSKYHRFKDGSFSLINESLHELSELTTELNITDKLFLKENISVPMYRMLYLNSLQSDLENMRVHRSRDFKKLIETYENSLNFDEEQRIPTSLNKIMRDYQKTGFEWLQTLGNYHLGGILADDMGLGKTVQAIALMLYLKENSQEHKQSIVICPSSLTINWVSEIQKFAPQLSTVCLNGTAVERSKLFEELEKYDVVITSYATVLRDIDKYEDFVFALQFLDEAQNIKNHNTQSAKAVKAIKSELRFALTGTPIENTLAELWSIFDFIMPGYLYNYSYFKKNYEVPIVKKNDEKAVKSLQRLTSPFVLRRLKKDVLTELPDKTETILYTEMQSEQKKLYTANVAEIKGELKELSGGTDKIKILAMLTRLRQICCDPSLVYENYSGESAKLEQCIELVKNCTEAGHKILLFSQFTTMLERISARFEEEGISYFTLTGKTKSSERLRLVNEFNENNVNVFLISLKAGGTGLNLTGADIVIHYDPWWNLSAENQASDRVYRIGQKNNVQIYKLIVKDTIEEKIRILQQKKSDLLEIAVNGDGDIMNMTPDEVISLLEE